MELPLNNIMYAKYIKDDLEDQFASFDEAAKLFMKSEISAYMYANEIAEDATYTDRMTGETRIQGLKKVNLVIPNKSKYYKLRVKYQFSYNNGIEMYVERVNIFDRKIQNGLKVEVTNVSTDYPEFMRSIEELKNEPNFIQSFENTDGIVGAIDLYSQIVNKLEREESEVIPMSLFSEKLVNIVDTKYVNPEDKGDLIKGNNGYYVYSSKSSLFPVDSIGNKFLALEMEEPIKMSKSIKSVLRKMQRDNGEVTVADGTNISEFGSTIKFVDYKVKKVQKNLTKLTLIVLKDFEIDESKYFQFFDRLSRIKSKTMLSVVKRIKANQLNNNNLFQFLFNNGDVNKIGQLDGWENDSQQFIDSLEYKFNDKQEVAFKLATDANPITFIQGPPGTGKTFLITQLSKYYNQQGKKVLLSSQTNVAVENILENLNSDKSFSDFAIKADKNAKNVYSSQRYKEMIAERIGAMLNLDVDLTPWSFGKIINETNVIGSTTTSSALNNRQWRDFNDNVDVLIVDEISKSSVPELIRFVINAKKIIFVGDQKQLAPLDEFDDDVMRKYTEDEISTIKKYISVSIFDKLFEEMDRQGRAVMLEENRRSVKDVCDIYSVFYNNRLHPTRSNEDSNIKWVDEESKPHPVITVAVNGAQETKPNGSKSRINPMEAEHINKILDEIVANTSNTKELKVAIIAMYGAQVGTIRDLVTINKYNKEFKKVDVNTVDAYQGDQANIVIISTGRADTSLSNGFLTDYRRLNVAISRAQDQVFILGSDFILKEAQFAYEGGKRYFFKEIYEQLPEKAHRIVRY